MLVPFYAGKQSQPLGLPAVLPRKTSEAQAGVANGTTPTTTSNTASNEYFMTFGESLIETRSVMKRGMLERVMLLTPWL